MKTWRPPGPVSLVVVVVGHESLSAGCSQNGESLTQFGVGIAGGVVVKTPLKFSEMCGLMRLILPSRKRVFFRRPDGFGVGGARQAFTSSVSKQP
jgi:hypothetical protein